MVEVKTKGGTQGHYQPFVLLSDPVFQVFVTTPLLGLCQFFVQPWSLCLCVLAEIDLCVSGVFRLLYFVHVTHT